MSTRLIAVPAALGETGVTVAGFGHQGYPIPCQNELMSIKVKAMEVTIDQVDALFNGLGDEAKHVKWHGVRIGNDTAYLPYFSRSWYLERENDRGLDPNKA